MQGLLSARRRSTRSSVRARLGISILLLLSLSGAHWWMLQTVAWSGMIVTYSAESGLLKGIEKTFDGDHPCKMCNSIKAGRAEEKQPEKQQVKPGSKLELGLVWQPACLTLPRAREWVESSDESLTLDREGPPKPRPRALASTVLS